MSGMKTTYCTRRYSERYDPADEREQGLDGTLERYETEDGRIEFCMTVDEREQFEADADMVLESDKVTDEQMDELLRWADQEGVLE